MALHWQKELGFVVESGAIDVENGHPVSMRDEEYVRLLHTLTLN